MRALSVRQPYADQIMRGTKCIENRSRPTKVRGRIYIYASLTPAFSNGEDLPHGVIVGTVELFDCRKSPRDYEWNLRNPKRLARPLKPKCKPQPVWFNPFPKKRIAKHAQTLSHDKPTFTGIQGKEDL